MRHSRGTGARAAIACAALVLFALSAASAPHAATSAVTARASASVTFTDPASDAPGSSDITNVNASVDDAGVLHFQISIPGSTTQANGGGFELFIDPDLNGSSDYVVFYAPGASTPGLFSCPNGGTCQGLTDPKFSGSYSQGPIFQMSRNAIGAANVTRIQFLAVTLWNNTNYYYDRAPDKDWYTFDIGSAVTGVLVDANSVTASPQQPVAGRPFTVSFKATTNTGTPLPSGTVTCTASVGGASMPGSGSVANGSGSCTWSIPANAGGKQLVARGTIAYPGASTNGFFSVTNTVVGKATLKFGGLSRARPVAGQYFTLGVAVFVHQPGLADTRIQQGNVSCRASIAGHGLRTVRAHVAVGEGVQCTWLIPAGTRGKTLVALLTVRSGAVSLGRSFSFRIS